MRFEFVNIIFITKLFDFVTSQCADQLPCFAAPLDISKNEGFNLNINSLCGSPPEDFCAGVDCNFKCDGNDPTNSYSPSRITDAYELETFWKSRNFDEPVTMVFDFGSKMILHQITITFQFEFPNGLYIQKSSDDGTTYLTLMYYAIRCNDTFQLAEANKYNRLDVLCFKLNPTSNQQLYQISYAPRRDNYVATEVLKGGIVRDYYIATNVKIILEEFFKPSDFNPNVADRRKFYFAIRDVDIQASCYCNGMSNQCDDKDFGKCVCQKNTEGNNCERCKPLFNNKPWTFGQACDGCTCNNHASSCFYNAAKGVGVCQNCIHNTKGDECDECKSGFFRNTTFLISSPEACAECDCDTAGVLFGSHICDPLSGKCICKIFVEGDRCDTCKDGFFGLSGELIQGCDVCDCSTSGTVAGQQVCNKTSGQCLCKEGFTDRRCSTCKPGYYGFPVSAPSQCVECNCNPSGSVNMTCDQSGQCFCRDFYFDRTCSSIRIGYFSANVWQLWFGSISAVVSSPVAYTYRSINITDASGNTFFVLGYVLGLDPLGREVTKLTYTFDIPGISNYEVFVQYMSANDFSNAQIVFNLLSGFTRYSCNNGANYVETKVATTLVGNLPSADNTASFGTACLTRGRYSVELWFPANSASFQSSTAKIFIMAMLLIPKYQHSVRYLSANLQTKAQIVKYYGLAQNLQVWSQQEAQGAVYMSYLYGSLYDDGFSCNCDPVGSINPAVCNTYGGQCNCKQNIYGRTCSTCLPDHYNFTSGLGCRECDCNLEGSDNNSCDPNTGQCPCKSNVIGRTCNKCALNYYGISSAQGCRACACNPLYSVSSSCDQSGNCRCKPGVSGAKCTQCANGYYDLTINGCKSCDCNPLGTAGNRCNTASGICNCKALTMGERCANCTVGYYGFSSEFPDTCLKCHCTGKTSDCDVAPGYYIMFVNTTFSTRRDNNLLEGWKSVDENGVNAGKGSWNWAPEYSIERGFLKVDDTNNSPQLYFSAPDIYLGNKRSSYMYYLTFDMTQQSVTNPRNRQQEGDIIIKGKNQNFKLVALVTLVPLQYQRFRSYKIKFYEKNWFKNTPSGDNPSSLEMLNTLSDLEYIYIRAKWTSNDGEFCGLSNVVMQYSTYNIGSSTGLTPARNVEYCNCPVQYSGQFCQECNVGFTRDPPNGGASDDCKACQCNSHAAFCDKANGTCFNCLHNTKGNNCEFCKDGFYGTATNKQPDDCKSCLCPGGPHAPNQFATKCSLNNDNSHTCTDCQTGYTGQRCERCSDGYYGNPMDPRGKCQKCTCNGNIDPSAAGNCNTETGECLRCLYDTFGKECEFCRPGFFGDAIAKSCRACSCNTLGSVDTSCQNMTGQCNCRPNVVGRICDKCAENTYDFNSADGCKLCQCHLKGSKTQQCNLVTGKCECNPRVEGDKCDRCATGYYDLDKGCLPCNCNTSFTVSNTTCHPQTGQCQCRDSSLGGPYSGRTCSECSVNAIGTPPHCELCHSPCYDNWNNYINREASEIARMQANVTSLLSKFGGMSYERIEMELDWLNGNLSAASTAFSGARYNTSEKLEQFKVIETKIVEYEGVTQDVEQQLTSSSEFFTTTVSKFDGTVKLSAQVPQPSALSLIKIRVRRDVHLIPITVNASYVMQMAEGFIASSKTNRVSGRAIFMTVQDQYEKVVSSNTTIADAAQKLSEAVSDLSKAAAERSKVEDILDTQYKAAFATNTYELKKIHDIVASIMIMQNKTVTIHQAALTTLESAKMVINQAEANANKRRSDASTVVQKVSRMKVEAVTLKTSAMNQKKTADDLKRKVDDVLLDVQEELQKLSDAVLSIAQSRNSTLNILNLAYEITNMTMPISLSEIQELSEKIQNTAINEGMINSTFADAQTGLRKAQEVQERSKEALDLSQNTLQQIQNLELTMSQSSSIRQESIKVQTETDIMIRHIQNISAEIEQVYSTTSGQGGETLSLLKSAITQAESNKMCFVNAKSMIDNATVVSQAARKTANEAYGIHQTNSEQVPQYAKTINDLYMSTSTIHTQAEMAKQSADKLFDDVTEAETLLNDFNAQKNEMEQLKSETISLEAELNDLLLKFEAEKIKFKSCNNP
ncbi:laminin subunit gamma-1-like [Clytia hemisphaerica]|uniref:Uncharacterized protein n=1 Tax=Clytia hemisphaerica TaxID=252671 RepID=A0A7M5X4C7_9CNID